VFYVLGFASNANCYFGSLINSNSIFYGYVASKNKNIKQCPTEGCLGSDRRSQTGFPLWLYTPHSVGARLEKEALLLFLTR